MATVHVLRSGQHEAQQVANLIHQGDAATNDAEQSYKAAGAILQKMKGEKPKEVSWPDHVRAQFKGVKVRGAAGMSWQWANKLIRMNKGEITLEDYRIKSRQQTAKQRQRKKTRADVGAGGKGTPAGKAKQLWTDPHEEPCTDCINREDQWQRSVLNNTGDAIVMRDYWTRVFGDEWKTFSVTADMERFAHEAMKSWKAIAEEFTARRKLTNGEN
jgi:hypothetical protein